MVEVKIPFLPEFKPVMLDDTKTWTARNKRYGKPGDIFRKFGHIFEILKVERRILDDIARNHYKEEGCKSRAGYVLVWIKLHPRKGWKPMQRVFVHIFRRISI